MLVHLGRREGSVAFARLIHIISTRLQVFWALFELEILFMRLTACNTGRFQRSDQKRTSSILNKISDDSKILDIEKHDWEGNKKTG